MWGADTGRLLPIWFPLPGSHHVAAQHPGLQAGKKGCPGGELGTPFDGGKTA